MANSKGSSNFKNVMLTGKHPLLPPKSPFPSVSPAYADYAPTGVIGPKAVPKPRQGNMHHQRTSSESFLLEEQPSWLDDLLNEPETPVRKGGHRRSSSDSFAYFDVGSATNIDYAAVDEYRYKNLASMTSWASQDFDYLKDVRQAPFYAEANSVKPKNRAWELPVNALNHPISLPSGRDNAVMQNGGSTGAAQEADGRPSTASEKLETAEAGSHDLKLSSEQKDNHAKPSASDTDTKRAKQQFAQRSRVRKLQYIAELERNVHALQAEGSEFSAELEFLNQQNLILSMENKALKQRLESLAQEQLIKCLEQEVLEREIGRLRALYGQQKHQLQHKHQQPPPSSSHRRSKSRDLDSQFANLSLKHKDANSAHDAVTGPLRI